MTRQIDLFTRGLSALILAALLWTGAALAQQVSSPDYEAWETIATRAESMVDAGRADDARFESLRQQVAEYREQFLVARDANASRIQTLQAQLDALGPPPDDGTEAPEISRQRDDLNKQLADVRAPVVRAEAAYSRANAIVTGIDRIIRERQAEELLQLGPSPLNPVIWPQALADVTTTFVTLWGEISQNVTSTSHRSRALQNLPAIMFYLILGIALIARGRPLAHSGIDMLRRQARGGSGVFRFLLSLGLIVLPYLGVVALLQGLNATGFVADEWNLLLAKLPLWAAMLFGILWLADQAFNDDDSIAVLPLPREARPRARRISNILAWLYVLESLVATLIEIDGYSRQTAVVVQFPILFLAGFFLFRLGRVRNDAAAIGSPDALEAGVGDFRLRFARALAKAIQVIGVVGPLLGAVGYARVGEALVYPAIASLALIGLVMVLQRFLTDLYELLTGRHSAGGDSLIPVLGGFLLSIAAMPFIALIWGAREADLTEIWTRIQEGVSIGETRITPLSFFVVIVVFIAGLMMTRLLQGALRSSVLPKTKIDQGGQNAIVSGVGYVGIILAVIVAVTSGGLDLSSLAIVAGALSVGIGFGLQNIVSNFVSGIILLIERPIGEGDWIEVNGTHGIVKDISVRSTRLETFDKYDMIIPNADLVSGTVSNYTRGNSLGRIIIDIGVAYGTDTRKVERILLNIAREHEAVLMNPAPAVDFMGFGADSLDFRIRAVLYDIGLGMAVRTEMRHQIVERFTAEGIEIPFAQRDVWLRNPEALAEAMDKQRTPDPEPEDAKPGAPRSTTARPLVSDPASVEGED